MKVKRTQIYPKKLRIPLGVATATEDRTTKLDDVQPVFYWDTEERFYETLLHDYTVKSIIDLTPGAGTLAVVALRKRIGYLGICMSGPHRDLLAKRLRSQAIKDRV